MAKLKEATESMTRHGHRKVLLYDAQTNTYITISEWAAVHKLKNKHIKDGPGGRYCLASEVEQYINIPPQRPAKKTAEKVEKPKAAKVEKPVEEKKDDLLGDILDEE